ncbi:phosphopantetheine adenylyltransferase [Nonomuraea dietziae]|uniref:phosphopantetheine adenylyltransferase n=1 Tax=Nonomuraea dietziae TaxID=65515 RepID=UPI0031E44E2C
MTVAVLINVREEELCSPVEERSTSSHGQPRTYPNVRVERFHVLLVDSAGQNDIPAIVKGIRVCQATSAYELQMAAAQLPLVGVETLFHADESMFVPVVAQG